MKGKARRGARRKFCGVRGGLLSSIQANFSEGLQYSRSHVQCFTYQKSSSPTPPPSGTRQVSKPRGVSLPQIYKGLVTSSSGADHKRFYNVWQGRAGHMSRANQRPSIMHMNWVGWASGSKK